MKKMIFNLLVVVCLYNIQAAHSQNLLRFNVNGKIGLKNKSGAIIVPAKYDVIRDFSEGIATVAIGDIYGAINQFGKEIIPVKFDYIGMCSEGLIAYIDEESIGYFNKTGVVEFYYNKPAGTIMLLDDFSDGVAIIQEYNLYSENANVTSYYCINKQGNVIFQFDEDIISVEPFSEGLAVVRSNNNHKYGYVNKQGQLVISKRWDGANSFKNGKARVMISEKNPYYNEENDDPEDEYFNTYYYINKDGGVIEKITGLE